MMLAGSHPSGTPCWANMAAFRAKRPCGKPGCPALLSEGRYCEKHKKAEPRRQFDKLRGNSSQRGYGAVWRKRRLDILARDPFCMIGAKCDPDNTGRRAPSTDVDHIVPKNAGGSDFEENLQGACHECHSWKTATQDSKFAIRK
jgi:5-methylcytosine-specific restriction enzyme A